jgi:hypothetical protein
VGAEQTVVSVDLAVKRYEDVGIAVLRGTLSNASCEFHTLTLRGKPLAAPSRTNSEACARM